MFPEGTDPSSTAADTLLDKIGAKVSLTHRFPTHGQSRDDRGEGSRTFAAGRYLIVYHTTADAVFVKRVIHGSRDVKAALDVRK